jgi:glycerate dehydrogenase
VSPPAAPPRIVNLDSFTTDQGGEDVWADLTALGALESYPRTSRDELAARCRGATALITNKVPLDGPLFAGLPELRYVGVCATGTNIVDLAAARAHGIAVTNVPGYGTEAVAQHTLALMLHFASGVAAHAAAVKAGRWSATPDFCFFVQPLLELSGKTLVVVGLGAIGGAVARMARGLGMNVVAAAVPGRDVPGRVPLAEALARADVVTLHCPLSPATTRLVDAAFLAQLKPGALLINTSRGGLVDEAALVAALRAGQLGGVALDVLTQEPPPAGNPLLDPAAPYAGRVVVTPHIAWGTAEARARLAREVAANLAAFQRGERRNRVD